MNCEETLKIIEALRVSGAVRFKAPGLELDFGGEQKPVVQTVQANVPPTPQHMPPPPPVSDNARRIQDLIDLLKKNDEQLVDEIFPAGA